MLQKTYGDDTSVTLAQVAIDSVPGSVTMHAVSPNSRLRGSSSIHPKVIESASWLLKDRDTSVVTTPIEVPTLTLDGLLEEYSTPKVDWLVVDTEGHDGVVVGQVTPDFVARTGLRHVIWERIHLPKREQRELTDRFEEMDFEITTTRRDSFATKR
jgi:FkbM family methyltransferase